MPTNCFGGDYPLNICRKVSSWYLIWFLTVEGYDGVIFDRHEQNRYMETQTKCLIELEAKEHELLAQIGKRNYVKIYHFPLKPGKHGFPIRQDQGISIDYRGTVIGYSIGCNQR